MHADDAAAKMLSLGNPVRLRIYRLLVRAGPPGIAVGAIQERLEIPASTLSHHIRALVSSGLAEQHRNGTRLMCHAKFAQMRELVSYLSDECCADQDSRQ